MTDSKQDDDSVKQRVIGAMIGAAVAEFLWMKVEKKLDEK